MNRHFWTMAHSIVVTKNSVYTSQAQSFIPSIVGDWKSHDPVNIHSHARQLYNKPFVMLHSHVFRWYLGHDISGQSIEQMQTSLRLNSGKWNCRFPGRQLAGSGLDMTSIYPICASRLFDFMSGSIDIPPICMIRGLWQARSQ